MIKSFLLATTVAYCCTAAAQGVQFGGTDTAIVRAFAWAKAQALQYKGKPGDPVGPWYESALPPRDAFCMRDVSHQSVGAAILGLDAENKNMLTLFARNISASKNWCSYWEINKHGVPAPDDYLNDREFWYNLNANFDVLWAAWRVAAWTGDSSYYEAPVFRYFQQQTADAYIKSWVLQPDSLLTRPTHPNAPVPFHEDDKFHRCRGLPSYSGRGSKHKDGCRPCWRRYTVAWRPGQPFADNAGRWPWPIVLRSVRNNTVSVSKKTGGATPSDATAAFMATMAIFGIGEGETFAFVVRRPARHSPCTPHHRPFGVGAMEYREHFPLPYLYYREKDAGIRRDIRSCTLPIPPQRAVNTPRFLTVSYKLSSSA